MKLFGILLLTLSFGQCASVKTDKNPPFKVEAATYNHVTGGMPGNSTLNLMIEFTSPEIIDFKNVYFQNKITKAVIEQKGDKQYIAARYNTSSGEDRKDIVLHSDPQKEYGNAPVKNFPFELKENEAMVSYTKGEKIYYFKIENIVKGKSVFMPSAKPQQDLKHL